jgi:hypothetical protein
VSDEVAGSTLDPSTPEPSPGTLLPDSGKDEQGRVDIHVFIRCLFMIYVDLLYDIMHYTKKGDLG